VGSPGASHAFAGVRVAEYDSALEWYERLLCQPPDLLPTERET
jgi:hypothetical protein